MESRITGEGQPAQPHLLLTVRQVAVILQLGVNQVYRMCADGTLPAVRIGGQWRVPRPALEGWVAALCQEAER